MTVEEFSLAPLTADTARALVRALVEERRPKILDVVLNGIRAWVLRGDDFVIFAADSFSPDLRAIWPHTRNDVVRDLQERGFDVRLISNGDMEVRWT